MSTFKRGLAMAALAPMAALAVSFVAAPAAQAATPKPLTIRPATQWVNCSALTEGETGGQYWLNIACSPLQENSWEFVMECSNGWVNSSGYYTVFENVTLDCPAGSYPTSATVYYTT
jgi:hypothetical protein